MMILNPHVPCLLKNQIRYLKYLILESFGSVLGMVQEIKETRISLVELSDVGSI
jgi:hypothetical protein